MKTYILITSHNLDRLVTNNVNGLLPRTPLMLYCLSAVNDKTYDIVCPPVDRIIEAYKLLLTMRPNGAEQYISLNFEKEKLNEKLDDDVLHERKTDFEWPTGYQFSIEDAEGSPASITNIFSKEMIPFKPTQDQLDQYNKNIGLHRKNQLGSIISRRGNYNHVKSLINGAVIIVT